MVKVKLYVRCFVLTRSPYWLSPRQQIRNIARILQVVTSSDIFVIFLHFLSKIAAVFRCHSHQTNYPLKLHCRHYCLPESEHCVDNTDETATGTLYVKCHTTLVYRKLLGSGVKQDIYGW